MIEVKTWYAATNLDSATPHFWLYTVRIAEDPWGIGSFRWDFHDTDPAQPWRGGYEKINDQLHRIAVKRPWGRSGQYELRRLDEDWIADEAAGFCALPLMTPAGELIRQNPTLDWVRDWLDYTHGKRIAWLENQFALSAERKQRLTDAMVAAFILECSRYDLTTPTGTAIHAEPEGLIQEPPWAVKYVIRKLGGEYRMQVRISNRFTNTHEFSIGQTGDVNYE